MTYVSYTYMLSYMSQSRQIARHRTGWFWHRFTSSKQRQSCFFIVVISIQCIWLPVWSENTFRKAPRPYSDSDSARRPRCTRVYHTGDSKERWLNHPSLKIVVINHENDGIMVFFSQKYRLEKTNYNEGKPMKISIKKVKTIIHP